MMPEREASDALAQGLLVPVLSVLEPKPLAIHGIYQSREYQPAALPHSLMHWRNMCSVAKTLLSSPQNLSSLLYLTLCKPKGEQE